MFADLDFLGIASGSGDEIGGVQGEKETESAREADGDGEEIFSEAYDIGGDTADGGIDGLSVDAFAGDGGTSEIVSIFFSGVFDDAKAKTGFEKVIEAFPPAIVAGLDVNAEVIAEGVAIGVLDSDLEDGNVAADFLDVKTGVIAAGVWIETDVVLTGNIDGFFGEFAKSEDGIAIVMAGTSLVADREEHG